MNKKIIINNDNDYKRLISKIKLYKSLLYHNTIFELVNNTDNKNIEIIVTALNIKKRKERIKYIYIQSCDLIDKKAGNTNICGFINNRCYVQRKLNNGKCNGCCRFCLYQTKNGCSTRNLSCKLFNCSEVTSRHEVIKYEDLKLLKLLSLKNQLIVKSDYFSKQEDVLKDLYSYSIIYSTIRIVYRLTRNYIYFKKRHIKCIK